MKSDSIIMYTNDSTGQSWWMYKGRVIKSTSCNAAVLSATHYALRDGIDLDVVEGMKFLVSVEGLLLE